jgi:hypothetical protein
MMQSSRIDMKANQLQRGRGCSKVSMHAGDERRTQRPATARHSRPGKAGAGPGHGERPACARRVGRIGGEMEREGKFGLVMATRIEGESGLLTR